ncbi:MAG: alpha,alpha-trehalose-phosphate synthase (UDP-forming) [Proteobacteria bacterium]|nr:alpha,alpha-trehalose-phosphate synthase (UDP-forming) [Pseudomonadota bacterium]
MSRLVVVSNRVAVAPDAKTRAGGLAVALQDALRQHGGVWFGWSGKVVPQTTAEPTITKDGAITYATVDLSRKNSAEYYNGFANRSLWPLFHYRLDLTAFSKQNYSGYLRVNTMFAEKLLPLLEASDLIWVHDYHLIPLGEELRKKGVTQPMGFFLHTPFPAMEIFIALPSHYALVRALCSYDVVGFQTENDLRAFLDYIVHEAGGSILGDHLIRAFGRTVRVEVFPIGIDTEDFVKSAKQAADSESTKRLRKRVGKRLWLIGVDRLDYSKGLVERFHSFERLLETRPEYRGKVTLMQIAPPTRSEVPEYREIRRNLETEAGHINGRFADFDWTPIHYLNKSFKRQNLAGFFRVSRIGLVTPLRDGMNFVAKEYVAAQDARDPGVLVLSRFAGAARELDAALLVNPFDYDAVADAMARGIEMPLEERRERWAAMMVKLRANTLSTWRDSFLKALAEGPY